MKIIQEFWAELVAAGLAPDWKGAYFRCGEIKDGSNECNTYHSLEIPEHIQISNNSLYLQLRKDGIDLVKLEWQNPGGQDIGKMCWYYDECGTIVLLEFHQDEFEYAVDMCKFKRYLLATHGRLCPAVDNFLEVYNEK